MKVYYDDSAAGDGKTERAIERIVEQPSKTLFITERKESFSELDDRIQAMAKRSGVRVNIRPIHGGNCGYLGVAKTIAELPSASDVWPHRVVIATHEALLRSDFNGYDGWRVVIDEVPRFLDFEQKTTAFDIAFFQQIYQLEQLVEGWSTVTFTEQGRAVTTAEVRADQSHEHLALFHARIIEASTPGAKRHVLCNMADWTAMSGKVQWCWASVFSLRALEAFDRVELLGNRFRDDIGCEITAFFDGDDVEWVPLPISANNRTFQPRPVDIHFYSERPSAKSWFSRPDGQELLKAIGLNLKRALPQTGVIWTANETSERGKPSPKALLDLCEDTFIKPKQAGTNKHDHVHHAAIIYAAKPCQNLRSLLKLLDIDAARRSGHANFRPCPTLPSGVDATPLGL